MNVLPRDQRTLLITPALLTIIALFVYPFAYGLMLTFNPLNGQSVWANYFEFFTNRRIWYTLIITLQLAVPATIINVLGAIPMAFILRRKSSYQKLVTTILVIPITLGTVLIANGMLSYFSPNGWFSQAVTGLNLYDGEVRLTHNYWGVLISLIISGFPFSFLLILSYVSGIDPTLARAAATLGANPWEQFRRIYLPLLASGLTMTACLTFVQAFSVFPSAILLGVPAGATRVMSIAAYEAAFEAYDYSLASTIAILMGFAQLIIVGLLLIARRAFYSGPVSGGKG